MKTIILNYLEQLSSIAARELDKEINPLKLATGRARLETINEIASVIKQNVPDEPTPEPATPAPTEQKDE